MDQATHNRIVSFIWGGFTRHFYKPQQKPTLAQINADILAVEKEADGLLDGLLVEATLP